MVFKPRNSGKKNLVVTCDIEVLYRCATTIDVMHN